jgi:hypothetical protein
MEKKKVISTPFVVHFKLSTALSPKSDGEMSYMENILYFSVVGSLMYLIMCTRPDIVQVISVASRYLFCTGKKTLESGEVNFSLFERYK